MCGGSFTQTAMGDTLPAIPTARSRASEPHEEGRSAFNHQQASREAEGGGDDDLIRVLESAAGRASNIVDEGTVEAVAAEPVDKDPGPSAREGSKKLDAPRLRRLRVKLQMAAKLMRLQMIEERKTRIWNKPLHRRDDLPDPIFSLNHGCSGAEESHWTQRALLLERGRLHVAADEAVRQVLRSKFDEPLEPTELLDCRHIDKIDARHPLARGTATAAGRFPFRVELRDYRGEGFGGALVLATASEGDRALWVAALAEISGEQAPPAPLLPCSLPCARPRRARVRWESPRSGGWTAPPPPGPSPDASSYSIPSCTGGGGRHSSPAAPPPPVRLC